MCFILQKVYFLVLVGILCCYIVCVIGKKTEKVLSFTDSDMTTIVLKTDSISLGKIKWGYKKRASFYMKNTGKYPLVIKEAKAVCGCTQVIWSNEPVKPGRLAKIAFIFEATSQGDFVKIINVRCNTLDEKYELKISGEVSIPNFK